MCVVIAIVVGGTKVSIAVVMTSCPQTLYANKSCFVVLRVFSSIGDIIVA